MCSVIGLASVKRWYPLLMGDSDRQPVWSCHSQQMCRGRGCPHTEQAVCNVGSVLILRLVVSLLQSNICHRYCSAAACKKTTTTDNIAKSWHRDDAENFLVNWKINWLKFKRWNFWCKLLLSSLPHSVRDWNIRAHHGFAGSLELYAFGIIPIPLNRCQEFNAEIDFAHIYVMVEYGTRYFVVVDILLHSLITYQSLL